MTIVLLSELLSVISHRGDVNLGHFVSYHLVDGKWFLNDDSKRCHAVNDPLLQLVNGESVEILFFKSSAT